ncbi:MAG: VanW family protein [Mycobacteriales bacterium]
MQGRWIGAALIATITAGVFTSVAVRSGESLPGTTVAGVEVGQLDRTQLRAAVQNLTDARTTGELPVVVGDLQAAIDRGLARIDLDGTVDRAMSAGRIGSPLAAVAGPLLGSGDRSVDLAVTVDEAKLSTRLDELAKDIDRPPATGGFSVTGLDVLPEPPQQGRTLDRKAALEVVADALRAGRQEPLPLPVTTSEPATTLADVEQVSAAARRALSMPYVLGDDTKSLRLSQREVGRLLRATQVNDTFELAVDQEALTALVTKQAPRLNVAPRDAGITVDATGPVLDGKSDLSWSPQPAAATTVPGTTGLEVDVPVATAKLTELILAGRSGDGGPLPLVTTEPAVTTADVQSVNSLIGTFTTYFKAGQPRARNIQRIAELVDGTYVGPGKVMSLNGTAGKRTKERGFVADGAIVDGELVDEVGGGVSQFATTLFNAAFFAGLPIEEYQAHSFYISRYPVGRESTVYFGAIDVKIRNDTSSGMLVRTRSAPGSVTVELYGNNGGRQVTAQHGPRRPRGDGGFRIDVTRTVSGGDGVSSNRVFKTSYDPAP